MILYRTDDFSSKKSTNLKDVLRYEIIEQENTDIFQSVADLLGMGDIHRVGPYNLKDLNHALDIEDHEVLEDIVDKIIKALNTHFNKNLKYALWLYPLENVESYYSFEGFDAMVDGYSTSDVSLIRYNDEGTLFVYEEEPKIVERV